MFLDQLSKAGLHLTGPPTLLIFVYLKRSKGHGVEEELSFT